MSDRELYDVMILIMMETHFSGHFIEFYDSNLEFNWFFKYYGSKLQFVINFNPNYTMISSRW